MAKKVKTKMRIIRGGDKLNTQKHISIYRLRRDGKLIEGFFAVGSMLNKAKRLKKPFIQWHVTNDLKDAVSYAIRHKEAWKIHSLKIEPILLKQLEESDNWDIIKQHMEIRFTHLGDSIC